MTKKKTDRAAALLKAGEGNTEESTIIKSEDPRLQQLIDREQERRPILNAAGRAAARREFKRQLQESPLLSDSFFLARKTPKDKKEILSGDIARDKALLYLADGEAAEEGDGIITEEQYLSLKSYLTYLRATTQDAKDALLILKGYRVLLEIQTEFLLQYFYYQREMFNLGRLFEIWQGIAGKEQTLESLYQVMGEDAGATPDAMATLRRRMLDAAEGTGGTSCQCYESPRTKRLRFDLHTERKEATSNSILATLPSAEYAISKVKSYIEAMDEHQQQLKVYNPRRGFLPLRMATAVEDILQEEALDNMGIAPLYRQSTLRKKKEAGEEISRREMDAALFPDYVTVKRDKETFDMVQKKLDIVIFTL